MDNKRTGNTARTAGYIFFSLALTWALVPFNSKRRGVGGRFLPRISPALQCPRPRRGRAGWWNGPGQS